MILKILSRHGPSYGSLIDYLIRHRENEKVIVFTHNLKSSDPALAVQAFLENESYRTHPRIDQTYLTHNILSFSNLDAEKITVDMLLTMAREFISLRGDTGIFYGAIHLDTESPHIHLMASGTELYTGKAMRMSHSKLNDIKNKLEDFQIAHYPELMNSICEHGKGKEYINTKQFNKIKRHMKNEIVKTITACLEQAKTQKEFLELLREKNLDHYERKLGEPTGIIFENSKYRFTRLGIDLEKLNSLPLDLTEEQKALAEIQAIRNRREERTQDRILRFEENGKIKTITYSKDLKETVTFDMDGNFKNHEESQLSLKEKENLDRMWEMTEMGAHALLFDPDELEVSLEDLNLDFGPDSPEDYTIDDLPEFDEHER